MKNTDPSAIVRLGGLDGVTLVQLDNGKIAAVSSAFDFNKQTGLAKVTAPDGTVAVQYQCVMLKDTESHIIGWAWPTIMQADLPTPDVDVMNAAGTTVVGKAYSAPIAGYWDVPVADIGGIVTHYAASGLLPDGNYVEVQGLAGTTLYHILAP